MELMNWKKNHIASVLSVQNGGKIALEAMMVLQEKRVPD